MRLVPARREPLVGADARPRPAARAWCGPVRTSSSPSRRREDVARRSGRGVRDDDRPGPAHRCDEADSCRERRGRRFATGRRRCSTPRRWSLGLAGQVWSRGGASGSRRALPCSAGERPSSPRGGVSCVRVGGARLVPARGLLRARPHVRPGPCPAILSRRAATWPRRVATCARSTSPRAGRGRAGWALRRHAPAPLSIALVAQRGLRAGAAFWPNWSKNGHGSNASSSCTFGHRRLERHREAICASTPRRRR